MEETTFSKKKQKHIQAKRSQGRLVFVMVTFIIVVCAFAFGFFVRGETSFINLLGFSSSNSSDVKSDSAEKLSDDEITSRVLEVETLLKNNSLNSVDLETATPKVLQAYTDSFNNAYVNYYSPERYESYIKENTNVSAGGIGVLFGEHNGRAYVVDVFENSPAYLAGIKSGDIVVAINGEKSHAWSLVEVVNAISNASDSIPITWLRASNLDASTGEEFTKTLKVGAYTQINITSEVYDSVCYIKVSQFTKDSYDNLKSIVDAASTTGTIKSFVLDLRDNPGGFLTQATNIANLFLKSGVIVQIDSSEGRSVRSADGEGYAQYPVVVLENERTSAAAEVVVAALKENDRATVIGHTSAGKGSIQAFQELSFGGAVRYTAAYYITPQGNNIDGVGIAPHVSVDQNASEIEEDTQKNFAIENAKAL